MYIYNILIFLYPNIKKYLIMCNLYTQLSFNNHIQVKTNKNPN